MRILITAPNLTTLFVTGVSYIVMDAMLHCVGVPKQHSTRNL
jgi:hypothetical protein